MCHRCENCHLDVCAPLSSMCWLLVITMCQFPVRLDTFTKAMSQSKHTPGTLFFNFRSLKYETKYPPDWRGAVQSEKPEFLMTALPVLLLFWCEGPVLSVEDSRLSSRFHFRPKASVLRTVTEDLALNCGWVSFRTYSAWYPVCVRSQLNFCLVA